jgi:XTP/dITP diphosphohydrolase
MTGKRVVVATGNAHKTEEITAMLGAAWLVEDLRSYPQLGSPEETGNTFEANARIKAEAASVALPGVWVLSDDSGLEVDALAGEPGVHSARYAGAGADDVANRERLKRELATLAPDCGDGWRARFRCCMALAYGGVTEVVFEGAIEGRVITSEQGVGGFGYDPLFIPAGYQETFGLLAAETKNQLSHRAQALSQVVSWLETRPT